MSRDERRGLFVRMFGSAVIIQGMLSATSFFVGLILIRRTSDLQYGYYVLINNALLFVSGLQGAFIQPPLVLLMTGTDQTARADLIGGLYRERRSVLGYGGAIAFGGAGILWACGVLRSEIALLVIAAESLILATLYRESFRMVLFSYRRSQDVLRADVSYVVIVLMTVPLATLTTFPAAAAVLGLAAAATASSVVASRVLWRREPWNKKSNANVLRRLAPIGGWSAAGSATHWSFSQGYNYVVAAVLDVPSVAALAATRLLMMPINLLSSGITLLMMPTAAAWLEAHGPAILFRRLWLTASGLATLALCYFTILWFARDAIFTHLIHKNFAQRDNLLLVWSAVFLVMVFRDQLQYLPGASALYRPLTGLTAISALLSLVAGYVAIRHAGAVGAALGVLLGEVCNVCGIIALSLWRIRNARPALVRAQ